MSKPNSYLLQYWKLFVNIANTELSKEQKVLLNQECKALTQAKNYTSQIRNNTRSSHADFMDVNTKKMAEYQKYNKAHKELRKITSEKSAPFTEILSYGLKISLDKDTGYAKDTIESLQEISSSLSKGFYSQKYTYKQDPLLQKELNTLVTNFAKRDAKKLGDVLNNTHFEKTTKLSFDDVFDKSSISLLEPGQGSSKISQLKKSIFELAKELAQTDNNMHVNSSAFKEMKKSLSSLGKSLNAYSPLNLDSLYQVSQDLENLHNASLNYIQKKGIGNQSTDLGKSRMMLALNIANNTFDFIDNFPTKEEMIRYEKEQLLHNDVEAEFDEFDNSF